MADLELSAGLKTQDVERALKQIEKSSERTIRQIERDVVATEKRMAREAANATRQAQRDMQQQAAFTRQIFTGLVGSLTIDRIVHTSWNALRDTIRGAAEDARTYARIQKDISRIGGPNVDAAAMAKTLDRGSRFSEGDIAGAFENLISQTGDVAGSVRNMNLVLDVAVDRNIDLAASSEVVAKAMLGETTMLGRMFPNLKELNRQLTDMQGTGAAAALVIAAVNKQVSGEYAADVKTAASAWDELKQSFSELAESSLGSVLAPQQEQLSGIAKKINEIQDAIDRNPDLFRLAVLAVLGGGAGVGIARLRGNLPGGSMDPGGMPIADLRMMDDRMLGSAANPFLLNPIEVKGSKVAAGGAADPLADMRRWAALRSKSERFGGIRGGVRESSLPFSDKIDDDGWGRNISNKIRDELEREDRIKNAVADTFADGIVAGAMRGKEGMVDVLGSALEDLARFGMKKLFLTLLGSAFGGGGGAALGGFLPNEALIPVGDMNLGMTQSVARRTDLRRTRLGNG